MLVGRILTILCTLQRLDVVRTNINEPEETYRLAARIAGHRGPHALLVHAHVWSEEANSVLVGRPCAAFWNIRDPRDATVSLMRLHEMTLPDAIRAMKVCLRAAKVAAPPATLLRYEDFVGDPGALLRELAESAGLACPDTAVNDIVAQTSPDAHRTVMAQLRHGDAGTRTFRTLRRTMLEDARTLINDRHIQSGATGRWR